jgi:hypothetical protein
MDCYCYHWSVTEEMMYWGEDKDACFWTQFWNAALLFVAPHLPALWPTLLSYTSLKSGSHHILVQSHYQQALLGQQKMKDDCEWWTGYVTKGLSQNFVDAVRKSVKCCSLVVSPNAKIQLWDLVTMKQEYWPLCHVVYLVQFVFSSECFHAWLNSFLCV